MGRSDTGQRQVSRRWRPLNIPAGGKGRSSVAGRATGLEICTKANRKKEGEETEGRGFMSGKNWGLDRSFGKNIWLATHVYKEGKKTPEGNAGKWS